MKERKRQTDRQTRERENYFLVPGKGRINNQKIPTTSSQVGMEPEERERERERERRSDTGK